MLLHITTNGFIVGLSPPDTEGVTRRVSKHGEPFTVSDLAADVELHRAELQRAATHVLRILNVQVEMDLLRIAIRPHRRHVVWGALDPHDPAALAIDDVVPITVGEHPPAEHARPEGALGLEVRSVEHHYLPDQPHP